MPLTGYSYGILSALGDLNTLSTNAGEENYLPWSKGLP